MRSRGRRGRWVISLVLLFLPPVRTSDAQSGYDYYRRLEWPERSMGDAWLRPRQEPTALPSASIQRVFVTQDSSSSHPLRLLRKTYTVYMKVDWQVEHRALVGGQYMVRFRIFRKLANGDYSYIKTVDGTWRPVRYEASTSWIEDGSISDLPPSSYNVDAEVRYCFSPQVCDVPGHVRDYGGADFQVVR